MENKMKKLVLKASILAIGLASGQAMAHIGYGNDLALASGATTTFTATSNIGQVGGLQPGYTGDTHNTRARTFTLTSLSNVNFTIRGLANTVVGGNANPYLNGLTAARLAPSFSLFKEANGNGVYTSEHDGAGDAAVIAATAAAGGNAAVGTQNAYNAMPASLQTWLAGNEGYASWSPFAKINDLISVAKGSAETGNNWGVYNADGNWSIANDNGQVNAWNYIANGAHAVGTNEVTYSGQLAAGTYSIFIGGDDASAYSNLLGLAQATNGGSVAGATVADFLKGTGTATQQQLYQGLRLAGNGNITFSSVAAVPVPGAVWLFLSGMMGVLGLNRRKKSA
jgi:hypothetical protein